MSKESKAPSKYNLRKNPPKRKERDYLNVLESRNKQFIRPSPAMSDDERSAVTCQDGKPGDRQDALLTTVLELVRNQQQAAADQAAFIMSQQRTAEEQAAEWRKARDEDTRRQEKQREEDLTRLRDQMEAEREWKRDKERDRNEKERLNQAVRIFPKMSSAGMLPVQLHNFSKLLDSLGADDSMKTARLPEVLTGQMAVALQNVEIGADTPFCEVRKKLFAIAGLTPSSAARSFMKPDFESLAKMSGVDVVNHVRSLVERVMADSKYDGRALCSWMFAFFNNVGTPQLLAVIANSHGESIDELTTAVYRCYEIHGSVVSTASHKQQSFTPRKDFNKIKYERPTCEKCGKVGHKMTDCWSGTWKTSQHPTPTCYLCQQPGHISSDCPKKSTTQPKDKDKPKDKTKKNNMVSVAEEKKENELVIEVSGCEVVVTLDSGADMSVIPSKYVAEVWYTGEMVELTDFEGLLDRRRKVALVPVKVGGSVYTERAAVSDHLGDKGLLKLSLVDKQRMTLLVNEFDKQHKSNSVCMVQTRAMIKKSDEEKEIERETVASENARVTEVNVNREDNSGESIGENVNEEIQEREEECVEDVGENISEVSQECSKEEHEKRDLGDSESHVELDCVCEGDDRQKLQVEVESDKSLAVCRRLANRKERGYKWERGLLLHCILDNTHGMVSRIVVPKVRRELLCKIAHDKSGHLGFRKVQQLIQKRFTWPNICSDVEAYCKSCSVCQKANKVGQKRVPMIERPVLSEPFEVVAIDLVGPLPKAKGYQYLRTTLCLATRWPDIIPLKSITAKAVAEALIGVFGRTGLPLQILSDNGSQFSGRLMKELTDLPGIELKHTTPSHPQTNGAIERMHGTLESMLRKAHGEGKDWVQQLPFALFALRQMPNRSTGFSPYELVWGRTMRTPLDIIYNGWIECENKKLNVCEWTEKLVDRLEVLRDCAVDIGLGESEKRKEKYDEGKVERCLEVGEKVWVRIPGKANKFSDSWDGPYVVEKARVE